MNLKLLKLELKNFFEYVINWILSPVVHFPFPTFHQIIETAVVAVLWALALAFVGRPNPTLAVVYSVVSAWVFYGVEFLFEFLIWWVFNVQGKVPHLRVILIELHYLRYVLPIGFYLIHLFI